MPWHLLQPCRSRALDALACGQRVISRAGQGDPTPGSGHSWPLPTPPPSSLWCSVLSSVLTPPRAHYGAHSSVLTPPCAHCGAPSSVLTLPVLTACLPCSHTLPMAVAGSLWMQTGAAGTASGCPASCADWVCEMLAGMRTGAAGTALVQGTPSLVAGGSHKSSCGQCLGLLSRSSRGRVCWDLLTCFLHVSLCSPDPVHALCLRGPSVHSSWA